LSHSVGAAITNRRELGAAEGVIMIWGAALLALLAGISAHWPKAIAFPLAVMCLWLSLSLVVRAFKLRRRTRKVPEDHSFRRAS
jgi:cardiolipin synthase